jgi:hypothetical protein
MIELDTLAARLDTRLAERHDQEVALPSSTVWSSISPLLFNNNNILNEKPDRFVVARL